MNCEKYKDYIMKHMDKTITETEQIELDEHLNGAVNADWSMTN